MMKKYRILIYGAGVIGSVYAVRLSNAGYDVTVFARGNRLQTLKTKGLLYNENNSIKKASVKILDKLTSTDIFDYIFVTVRYEQIKTALAELKNNNSLNVVTMVNNPDGYASWENIIGKDRLIPAFAGAGGKIENDVLYYRLTPKIIQPTTFGELDGKPTNRIKTLNKIFKISKIPCSVSKNMDAWQKSHLAMVTSLANGIYFDGGDNYTTAKNKSAIRFMSISLKKNFNDIRKLGIPITPQKLNIFRICPIWIMNIALRCFCITKFAEAMTSHALIAKNEMELLNKKFNDLIHN